MRPGQRRLVGILSEKNIAYSGIGRGIPGEPAEGVEGGGERHGAGERDAVLRRAQPDQAAEGCGDAHRAAGVGTGGNVGKTPGDCSDRAGRGTAGHAAGRGRIDRMRKMHVLAKHRESQFLCLGLAGESRAGVEKLLHRGGCRRRRTCLGEHVRVAASGDVACNVENVLHAERKARQRAGSRMRNGDVRPVEEGVQRVTRALHCSGSGYNGAALFASRFFSS